MNKPFRSNPILEKMAPLPGRYPLVPDLSPQQELALLCRLLHREGYDDHIAGHITLAQDDGSFLVNPWELAWDELTAADIIRVDGAGHVIEGEWNVTPAIGLHLAVHRNRHDLKVAIHNHPRWGSVWSAAGRIPPVYDQTAGQVEGDPVLYDEYAGTVDSATQAEAPRRRWAMPSGRSSRTTAFSSSLRIFARPICARSRWSTAAGSPGRSRRSAAANPSAIPKRCGSRRCRTISASPSCGRRWSAAKFGTIRPCSAAALLRKGPGDEQNQAAQGDCRGRRHGRPARRDPSA